MRPFRIPQLAFRIKNSFRPSRTDLVGKDGTAPQILVQGEELSREHIPSGSVSGERRRLAQEDQAGAPEPIESFRLTEP
jgi:hypothetical protein